MPTRLANHWMTLDALLLMKKSNSLSDGRLINLFASSPRPGNFPILAKQTAGARGGGGTLHIDPYGWVLRPEIL